MSSNLWFPESAQLFIQAAQSQVDLRCKRLIDAEREKIFFSGGYRHLFPKGPGPEGQAREKRQHAQKAPKLRVTIQNAIFNGIVQRAEAGVQAKAGGQQSVRALNAHTVISGKKKQHYDHSGD